MGNATTRERVGITEFARRRGVSKTAVQRAIREKRLRKSLHRLPTGRVLIEVQSGAIEWEENTNPGLSRAGKVLGRRRKEAKPSKPETATPSAPKALPIAGTVEAKTETNGTAHSSGENELAYRRILTLERTHKAELSRLLVEERQGRLVNAEDVKREVSQRARQLRERVMELPDRLADELAGEVDALRVRQILERELREALEEEANRG